MSVSGAEFLRNIGVLLLDPHEVVWSEDLKEVFVNEGLSIIALLRPDATAVTATLALTPNTPKQSIPSTGVRLLDVIRNTGGGRPVRKISREILNETVPAWTSEETETSIQNFMFDEENPKAFWVYPTPTIILNVEIVYSDSPSEFSFESQSIGIDDIFLSPLKEYVLYRCLNMPSKGQDLQKAAGYLQNFYNALGVKMQSDAILSQVQQGG